MPINAVCPECQNRFRLQESLVGKSMRCPVCQEVFIVKDAGGPEPPPAKPEAKPAAPADTGPRTRVDSPPVVSRSGSVTDFVKVITDVSSASPPRPPEKPKPPPPGDFPWVEGPRLPTIALSPVSPQPPRPAQFPWDEGVKPKPKEVTWSPDLSAPLGAPPARAVDEPLDLRPAEPEPTPYVPPVARKRRRGKMVVGVMLAFIVAAVGAGGFFLWRYINTAPERLFAAAEEDYDKGQIDQANKLYEQVANEHPKHRLAPKARFMADLSAVRRSNASPLNRADPQGSLLHWKKFLAALDDPAIGQFAAKDQRAVDVWETGKKLAEDVIGKAQDSFDSATPDEAERWLNEAAAIVQTFERFRPDDVTDPPSIATDMSGLRTKIDAARAVLTKIAEAKTVLANGTDDDVARAERFAKEHGIDKHPAFARLLEEKEQEIQAKAVYMREAQPIPPTAVPDDGLTSLLFAPRFDRSHPRPIEGTPAVFFCLARGVLYALDERDGGVLWAARTGLDSDIMPIRVAATAVNSELVLLASNTGNQFGLTARAARNGMPLWHQQLAVPCQGPPVVIGPNAYVAIGDRDGTILEINVATGDITGKITIGRPLGPMLAARPGTGLLYVLAEARAVYVFDVDRRDADGKRLDPLLLGVMNTGHPAGSLRGVPVFSNPDPLEPGPRFLILGQADGLDTMKLRAFPLPAAADGKPDGSAVAMEIPIPGWASFPPHCDGEKLAIVTDQGEFGLYGLALAGNRDLAMFQFPARLPHAAAAKLSRGQVVLADEGSFWILAAGELRRLRFGINATDGVRLIPWGDSIPAGEPLHAPQVNAGGDTFVVVTQEGMTCRATAVNALNGQVRWRRELGATAKGDPLLIGGDFVMLDHAGGMYRIDTQKLLNRGNSAWLVDERWLVAQPVRGFTALTGLIPGPNSTALVVLSGTVDGTPKLLVRKLTGNVVEDRQLPWAALAGQPIVSGQMLVLPFANGALYRLPISSLAGEFEEGPSWRADRLSATATCYLAALSPDELFATDGARSIVRWRWPASSKLFEMNGKLRLPERPGATPVVLPGTPPRLVVADGKGNLTIWDADKLAPPALKTWRPGVKNVLPAGPVSDGLRLEMDGTTLRIVYAVGGQLVWLSPDADGPKWVGPPPVKALENRPFVVDKRIYLTDRAGIVRVLDAHTGLPTREVFQLHGSHAFASSALPIGMNIILAPLADGTVVLGELSERKDEPKKVETPPMEKPKEDKK